MILDIHTHHPAPQPSAIIDASPRIGMPGMEIVENQYYSAGIHPYDTIDDMPDELWIRLETLVRLPQVVAIGEGGIDLSGKGGPLFRQLRAFRHLIDLSESLEKPLLVHCVKGEDIICGLRRDLKPKQIWVIHGFRRKPESASLLLRAGCMISFGVKFNDETLCSIPADKILAETDESPATITDVIARLSEIRGMNLQDTIARNSARVLSLSGPDVQPPIFPNKTKAE